MGAKLLVSRKKGNTKIAAGVDEAGRGSLLGPVVAAAVIIEDKLLARPDIRDSKTMSPQLRERVFEFIHKHAISVSIGVVSHHFIDKHNIHNASLESMRKAVIGLYPEPDIVLVDGIHKIPISIPQMCIKKGDRLNKLISAASIIAKVYRDRIMLAYHMDYPMYNLAKNKGYPTKQHRSMINKYGPCPLHRYSFKGVA